MNANDLEFSWDWTEPPRFATASAATTAVAAAVNATKMKRLHSIDFSKRRRRQNEPMAVFRDRSMLPTIIREVRLELESLDKTCSNAFLRACWQGVVYDISRELMKDPDAAKTKIVNDCTALSLNSVMITAALGNVDALRFLLQCGDFVQSPWDQVSEWYRVALLLAVEGCHLECATALLSPPSSQVFVYSC
jgi:hypothetical protein